HDVVVLYGVDDDAEARVALDVPDVVEAAGGKVVEHDDVVAAGQERVCEMGADESTTAGDESFHGKGGLYRPLDVPSRVFSRCRRGRARQAARGARHLAGAV